MAKAIVLTSTPLYRIYRAPKISLIVACSFRFLPLSASLVAGTNKTVVDELLEIRRKVQHSQQKSFPLEKLRV